MNANCVSPDWAHGALHEHTDGAGPIDPEAIVADTALPREQKIRILRMWGYDAAEAEVATEEGMPGNRESHILCRILLALHRLTQGTDALPTAPSKQHALL